MFKKNKTETPKKRRFLKVTAVVAAVGAVASGVFVFAKNRAAAK